MSIRIYLAVFVGQIFRSNIVERFDGVIMSKRRVGHEVASCVLGGLATVYPPLHRTTGGL